MPIRPFTKLAFKRLRDSGLGNSICSCPDDSYEIKFRRLPATINANLKHTTVFDNTRSKFYYNFLVDYMKEVILIAEENYKVGHGRINLTTNSLQMDKEAKESFKKGWEYIIENSHLLV